MVWVAAGATPHFLDRAAIAQRMIEGRAQRFRNKAKAVEAVALAAAIGADEESQRTEAELAGRDALVVTECEPL